ncbi:MAG: adenylate/guanylate cyclase domain-containing protein [Candidatus Acetothermia bacterium]
MVRSVLDAFNGLEIKQLGDGFLFSFNSSRQALNAALDIREGMKDINSRQKTDLSIRIGLHAGEVIREDRDVIGSTVNMAERVMNVASANQVVTSEILKNLAPTPGEFDFVEIGDRDLEGFSEPKKVYEVSQLSEG